MATAFQPPPTYAEVVIFEPDGTKPKFNPIWLKWFLDVAAVLTSSGSGGGGAVDHESLTGLLGGAASDHYHLTQTQHTGTGTGVFVRQTSPTLTTPVLGTPTSGTLTNCTGLPVAGLASGAIETIRSIPQNSRSAAYTTVLADAGYHIYHPTTDDNARTFTIDSNANVAYAIGTAITFVNDKNTVTIAITSDTLVWAEGGGTGSRTLANAGVATALKVTSTRWIISGTGLS